MSIVGISEERWESPSLGLVDLLFLSRREAERGEREAGREVYFVQRRRNPSFNTSTLRFSDPEQTQEEEEEPAANSQGPQRQTVTVLNNNADNSSGSYGLVRVLLNVISDVTDFPGVESPELSLSRVLSWLRSNQWKWGLRSSRCPPHKSVLPKDLARALRVGPDGG